MTPRILRGVLLAGIGAASGCILAYPARTAPHPIPPGLAVRAVSFPSRSGSLLRAWFVPGKPGRGAVLLLHGVGDNRTTMLARARFLHREGYAVLLPDLQAHGESPGAFITFGARESLDAAAALAFLRACAEGERTGVIGVSMGGAAALLGPGPLETDALVLESVYPTIRQAVDDRLRTWLGPFRGLARVLTPVVLRSVSAEIGVREADLQPVVRIGRLGAPVLLVAGARDPYTPLDESLTLFERAPEPKEMWVIEGARHEDLYAFTGPGYEQRVGDFLARHLRGAPAVADSGAATSRQRSALTPARCGGDGAAPSGGGMWTAPRRQPLPR